MTALEPTPVPLRRDVAVAVACGLAGLVLGSVNFRIPGLPGAVSDLSGLALVAAAFHVRRGWVTPFTAGIASFMTPPEGSMASTFAMHAIATPASWATARWLLRRGWPSLGLGLAWTGWVFAGYYAALLAPAMLVTNALFGLVPWQGLAGRYVPLVGSLRWEALVVAALTSLYLVNLRAERERRRAAVALRRAQKMEVLGQVAGGVAHDFGQLLLVLSMSSKELAHAGERGRPLAPILARLDGAVEQGWRMVRQLTAFARRQPTAPAEVDLGALLRRMDGVLRTAVGQKLRFELVLDPAAPPVHADVAQLEQVIMNLVINARDAVEAREDGPRRVEVRVVPSDPVRGEPAGAALEVVDTGVGMDDALQARLFEPFFTTKAEGSGLGLATVYGIVERHGAKLSLRSRPGEGTIFRVGFPSAYPRARPREEEVA